MLQKYLQEKSGRLHYGEFINDLSKQMITEFPAKINFYVMNAVNFFKSDCTEIKANASMLAGTRLYNAE